MRKIVFLSIILSLLFCFMSVCADNVEVTETTNTPEPTEMPATETPEPPMPWDAFGDINEDGSVNASDALMVLKYAAKIKDFSEITGLYYRGDVDRSDVLDASDALIILQYAADIIDSFEEIENYVPSTEVPEDYHIFIAGQIKNVTISEKNEKVTFEFTPTESGYYRYHSSDDKYAELGTINDSEGKLLVERTDIQQDHGSYFFVGKFSFDYYFEAGKTYYLDAFLEHDDTGSFKVTLMPLSDPEKVTINAVRTINCPYGTEKEIGLIYSPEYSIGFVDKWESSDTNVVTVDNNGKIKGVGIGKANVTVTTTTGLTDMVEIEVTDHNEIQVDELVAGTAVFETVNYYKFVPEKDGEYIVKTYRKGGNSNNAYLTVYNSEFNEALYSAAGINEEIVCEFKEGEVYYICLDFNAGDNGCFLYLEVIDIDDVLELTNGEVIQLPYLVASSGSPYTWHYDVAFDDDDISVGLITDDSVVSAPGDGVKTICTLTSKEPGTYYVLFRLSNESLSFNYEIIERVTYKVIVK